MIAFLFFIFLSFLHSNDINPQNIEAGRRGDLYKVWVYFDKKDFSGGFTSFLQGVSISLLNPKIFIWFVAIYSQFMSIENGKAFNLTLILTAGIVDMVWYVILTLLVTSNIALEFFKNKNV